MDFGWIKFFNPDKNYGFILQREAGDPDLWFSGSSVRPCDPLEITRNAVVAYNISAQAKRKELCATDIHVLSDEIVRSIETGEKISGTVNYFDERRGFGYVFASAGGSQLFFHKSNSIDGIYAVGDAVSFTVNALDDSLAALEVESENEQH